MESKKAQSVSGFTTSLNHQRKVSVIESESNMDLKELIVVMERMGKNLGEKITTLDGNIRILDGKMENMGTKIEKNSSLIMELSNQVNQLTTKHKDLDTTVQAVKVKTQKQDEIIFKKSNRPKRDEEIPRKNKGEIDELRKIQEDNWNAMAVLEMKQREMVLRPQGIKENQDEEIATKITKDS